MQDYNNLQLHTLNAMPSLGHILGTTSNTALVDFINASGDRSGYFASDLGALQAYRDSFMQKIVDPIREVGVSITSLVDRLRDEVDVAIEIKPATTLEALGRVSPRMYYPIVTHPPVLKLFKEGRIEGYGLSFDRVKEETPVYHRLFQTNGVLETYPGMPIDRTTRYIVSEWWSTDPKYTLEEMEAIHETLEYIDEVLETTNIDPTSPGELIG